jgi:pimeloyl-ACP methyl ester carboxylesterase
MLGPARREVWSASVGNPGGAMRVGQGGSGVITSRAAHDVARGDRRAGTWELRIFVAAVGAVALHVVDDNYLQPAPGTSAGEHLASGLVPLALLGLVVALYPRLRPGARAYVSMTLGVLAVMVGVPGVYHLTKGVASGDDFTGLLSIVAGVVLVGAGLVVLWRSRKPGPTRSRAILRRALLALAAVAIAFVTYWLVFLPIGFPYVYTHLGQTATDPELELPSERVTFPTEDGLELAATYVPSRNRAAVIVFPGATRVDEATMIARHGYGVLLVEPRGQGSSEGDVVRWAGDRDLHAAVAYLRGRPDVDDERIGAIGFSIGGEILIEAAAQRDGIAAVVSEGAGERVGEVDASGMGRILLAAPMAVMTASMTVFQNHGPPPPIVERIGLIAPRPVLLIYADPGQGGESVRQPKYIAAAGQPKEIWKVPGAGHTGGLEAQPEEYERRVVAFFDNALLNTS